MKNNVANKTEKNAVVDLKALHDNDLVKLIKEEKNQEAFLEIINRYSQKVYNLSFRITRNKEDAEEALQDTFLTTFTKLNSFKAEATFSSWLYRVASNAAFMVIRKRKKTEAMSIDEKDDFLTSQITAKSEYTDINYMSTKHELREKLQHAILSLPTCYRNIFIMRDVDRVSNEEIADTLGISVPAVKAKLHRARLYLRKELKAYYEDYTTSKEVYFKTKKTANDNDMAI